MINQISLFNDTQAVKEPKDDVSDRAKALAIFMGISREQAEKITLSDLCFLYTAGSSGANSGIRFMMMRTDAEEWCSSDVSRGVLHGHPWAYFFTSVENFCNCHWGQLKGVTLDLSRLNRVKDDGRMDDKIKAMGLKKYDKFDIQRILNCFGIVVKV